MYAQATTKRVPMFDPAVAAKVAEHVSGFYCQAQHPDVTKWEIAHAILEEQDRVSREAVVKLHANGGTDEDVLKFATEQAELFAARRAALGPKPSLAPIPFDGMALIEEKCGRYTRGAHKGQLRGWAEITIVERGGWKKDAPGYLNGHVERPGQIRSIRITDFTGRCYLEVR
jgi:hypothetical protein